MNQDQEGVQPSAFVDELDDNEQVTEEQEMLDFDDDQGGDGEDGGAADGDQVDDART